MTAKKTLKLGTIKMAIFNLFQCMSTQLKANLNVPVDDSHRQLNMVKSSQTLPRKRSSNDSQLPKGRGEPREINVLSRHLPFHLGSLLGKGNGQRTAGKPVSSEEVEQLVGPCGGRRSGSQAGWGRSCRSTHGRGLVSFTLALNSDSRTKAYSGGADPARQMLYPPAVWLLKLPSRRANKLPSASCSQPCSELCRLSSPP